MNADLCHGCHQRCDPLDPEYCVVSGARWHVTCALKQNQKDLEKARRYQTRHNTTAAKYAELQEDIEELIEDKDGLLRILHGVPEQNKTLGGLFMGGKNLVKRDTGGRLLQGESDPARLLIPEIDRMKELEAGTE